MWDPDAYVRYADERARPFVDLVARVGARSPAAIVDLGCGPGTLTTTLSRRWPTAHIVGVDSSPEMVARARSLGSTVEFVVGDVRHWRPDPDVGLVVSNATLQWVPGHRELLRDWATRLSPGAWLAVQVPGNFDAPSHRALRELVDTPRWRDRLAGLIRRPDAVLDPAGYAETLTAAGLVVDAWETTYLHLLPAVDDDHPVLRWMEGTALRPVRAELADPGDWARFREELSVRLSAAYPLREGVAYLPFRRVFVVARVEPIHSGAAGGDQPIAHRDGDEPQR